MPIFKNKKLKQINSRQNDPDVCMDRSSVPTSSQSLSPYPGHMHPHISDKFTGSNEWNDLLQSPGDKSQRPRNVAPPGRGEVPRITVSPAAAPTQGPRSRRGVAPATAGERFHRRNLAGTLPVAQQQDRGRPERRIETKARRRESVMERTRADLYHADLLDDASRDENTSLSKIGTKYRGSPTPSRHKAMQAPFSTEPTHFSRPMTHNQSNHKHSSRPTHSTPAEHAQHILSTNPADLRAERSPGATRRKNPQIGRRASVMENIMADPYHALMFEEGTIDDESDSRDEKSIANPPLPTASAPGASYAPIPIPARNPTRTTTAHLNVAQNTAPDVSKYSTPSMPTYAPPELPDYTLPVLPNYAPPALPSYIPPRFPGYNDPLTKNTIPHLVLHDAVFHHPLPDHTSPPPSPNDELPPLPASEPSTPSSLSPSPCTLTESSGSSVKGETQNIPTLHPITPSISHPNHSPTESLPLKKTPQSPKSHSESNIHPIPTLTGRQNPLSIYLTPRTLHLPPPLHAQITALGIAPADLDPEALALYLAYLETGVLRRPPPQPLSQSHTTWQTFYPLINTILLLHALHALERENEHGVFAARVWDCLLAAEYSHVWPDAHTIAHLFAPRMVDKVPRVLREWILERCVEARGAGLVFAELLVGFLAGVLRLVLGRGG